MLHAKAICFSIKFQLKYYRNKKTAAEILSHNRKLFRAALLNELAKLHVFKSDTFQ